jgi:hypothetical protein
MHLALEVVAYHNIQSIGGSAREIGKTRIKRPLEVERESELHSTVSVGLLRGNGGHYNLEI